MPITPFVSNTPPRPTHSDRRIEQLNQIIMAGGANFAEEAYAARHRYTNRAQEEFICLGMLKNIIERRGLQYVTLEDIRCLEAVLITSLRYHEDLMDPAEEFEAIPAGEDADAFRRIIRTLPWLLRRELVDFFDSEPLESNQFIDRFRAGVENGNMPPYSERARGGSVFIDPETGRLRVRTRPEVRNRHLVESRMRRYAAVRERERARAEAEANSSR